MIIVDTDQAIKGLKEIGKELSGRNMSLAISRSINRSLMQGRTVARKKVTSIYNISQRSLSAIDLNLSTARTLRGEILASKKPIPISSFDPVFQSPTKSIRITRRGIQKVKSFKRKKNNPGKGVTFLVIEGNGERVKLPFAFMTPGKTGVYARGKYNGRGFEKRDKRVSEGGNDLPIQSMVSLSIHNSLMNPTTKETINSKVNEVFPQLLEHEVKYRISKVKSDTK